MSQPNNLQKGSNLNTIHESKNPHKSNFKIQKPVAFTPRYGELYPFMCEDVVPGDKIKMSSLFDLRTYTLKSPLMQDVSMYKSCYSVPISAILPNNWDKVVETPNIGDVCPIEASCLMKLSDFYDVFSFLSIRTANVIPSLAQGVAPTTAQLVSLTDGFRLCALLEQMFSVNGLPAALGMPITRSSIAPCGFDVLFDDISVMHKGGNGLQYHVTPYDDVDSILFSLKSSNSIDFFYWLQDYSGYLSISSADFNNVAAAVKRYLLGVNEKLDGLSSALSASHIDLSRFYAYQLVFNEFHTNDNVDYIYSAKSWRAALFGLKEYIIRERNKADFTNTFLFNGDYVTYDACASNLLIYYSLHAGADSLISSHLMIEYVCQIFGLRRSLVYKDYFTNARVSPLAVGDTSVSVNANKVDVVNVTRNIQLQRFLNAVNRSGRKPSAYFKSLFGVNLRPDDDTPIFLCETKDVIYGQEVENTGAAQLTEGNSITTRLRTKSNDYQFETFCDKYGIIISLVHFEVERFYDNSCERVTLKDSLMDYFNPYMQYVGDQDVKVGEYDIDLYDHFDSPMGYATRDIQYKIGFPRAIGGFVNGLPTWLFLARKLGGLSQDLSLNPEFVRSLPSTFDKFYLSLTYDSFSLYWHFIVLCRNFIDADRPMVKNPQILG